MSATPLQIARNLHVTPLIDIHTPAFADTYRKGLWWALYGEYEGVKPIPDSYLVTNLKRDASVDTFSGQHDDLLDHLGFYFGMVHGALLAPHSGGKLRQDVTALITFTHRDTRQGYHVARRAYFYDAEIYSHIQTDSELIRTVYESARDHLSYADEPDSWYYSIGCLLGSLSIPLFPATSQEWQQWEAEHLALLAKIRRDIEPLDSIPAVEYSL